MRSENDHFEEVRTSMSHVPRQIVPVQEDVDAVLNGRVVIWTDRACPRNQCRNLRRAGSGIFDHDQHPRNTSMPLPGPEQTNQRAGFFACVAALQAEPRPVEIRTDSRYVIVGVANHSSVHKGEPTSGLFFCCRARPAKRH